MKYFSFVVLQISLYIYFIAPSFGNWSSHLIEVVVLISPVGFFVLECVGHEYILHGMQAYLHWLGNVTPLMILYESS